MPTYEYECQSCGQYTEAFQWMSDEPLSTCPSCGKESLHKIISGGGGVIVKGTQTPCHQSGNRINNKNKPRKPKKRRKPDEIPFWRSKQDGTINKDVLKNPQKYIETGEI